MLLKACDLVVHSLESTVYALGREWSTLTLNRSRCIDSRGMGCSHIETVAL